MCFFSFCQPHLHTIVNRSMSLAMTAKEPYNYFLLLRTLFRSIGGGSHDMLYQEFLPLLPNLLQGKWMLFLLLFNPLSILIQQIQSEIFHVWALYHSVVCDILDTVWYSWFCWHAICSCLLGLNSLQSGLHKQHIKDLFVELCLTVPVRLSSLLPYLPMLMDPLVSALNGSQTLVSQVSSSNFTLCLLVCF